MLVQHFGWQAAHRTMGLLVVAIALPAPFFAKDAPQSKVMVELRRRYYPSPLNKDRRGTVEDIEALTIKAVKAQYKKFQEGD